MVSFFSPFKSHLLTITHQRINISLYTHYPYMHTSIVTTQTHMCAHTQTHTTQRHTHTQVAQTHLALSVKISRHCTVGGVTEML